MNVISTSSAQDNFLRTAKELEDRYPVALQLLHRSGKRLEHAAGPTGLNEMELAESHVVELSSSWSVRVSGWSQLGKEEQRGLSDRLKLFEIQNHDWTKSEIVELLRGGHDEDIRCRADLLREEICGDEVHRRGLIEFSNVCKENCQYCGLRRENLQLPRYRMTEVEIFESAKQADSMGYGSIVLQSGEEGDAHTDSLCRVIEKIHRETKLAITVSIGEKTREAYKKLKDAGADRYLLRFETSNPELFKVIRPGRTLEKRLQCLEWLRDLGFQVGSGVMVGIPGQTLDDLANDLLLLKKLDLDMVGVGPFIPHPDTPLKNEHQGDFELTLRFVALVRLVTQNTHIPATTALGSIHPLGRQKALQGGANVIMPNVTPQKYRKFYEIYPNKICITEKPTDCAGCVGSMIHSLGRTLSHGPGHTLKL